MAGQRESAKPTRAMRGLAVDERPAIGPGVGAVGMMIFGGLGGLIGSPGTWGFGFPGLVGWGGPTGGTGFGCGGWGGA